MIFSRPDELAGRSTISRSGGGQNLKALSPSSKRRPALPYKEGQGCEERATARGKITQLLSHPLLPLS